MQDGLQTDVSSVPGDIAESKDEEDISDAPHSLGLSINPALLLDPPTSASTTPTHRIDPFKQHLGPTHALPSTAKAIDFLVKCDLFKHIVDQTNFICYTKPIFLLPL